MEQVTIETDSNTVYIDCPNCEYWEGLGIDDARHNFDVMRIDNWVEKEKPFPEVSINTCTQCDTTFKVIWDYKDK